MRSYLVMGLFALFVVAISLLRCLADEDFFRLAAMKRLWGRRRGLLMFFLANVALPMVLGVVFLSRGIVAPGGGFDPAAPFATKPGDGSVMARPANGSTASVPTSGVHPGGPGVFPLWLNVP
jgi:hypothetical protein